MLVDNITPEKIKDSKLPFVHKENGKHIVIFDARSYRNLSMEEKAAYVQAFMDEIDKSDMNNHLKRSLKPEYRKFFTQLEDKNYKTDNELSFGEDSHNFRLITLDNDSNVAPYSTFFDNVHKRNLPENANKIDEYFTLQHELGHAVHGLRDPGCDYVATIEVLLAYPEEKYSGVRRTLTMIADDRTTYDIFQAKTNKKNSYGHECGDAIRSALGLDKVELERLRSLPADERKAAILQQAHYFDDELRKHVLYDQQPELQIFQAIEKHMGSNFEKATDNQTKYPKIYEAAKDLLKKNCPFQSDSLEYKTLVNFVEAMERTLSYLTPTGEKSSKNR